MPLAGQRIKALDFTDGVNDTEDAEYTLNITAFGVATTGGTYVECGTSFLAPTSGKVMITVNARCGNNTGTAGTEVAPVVREGGTVGAGTVVLAGSSANAARHATGTAIAQGTRCGVSVPLAGLTPGSTYNVRLEHRVSGGSGTISSRTVTVDPRPGPPV